MEIGLARCGGSEGKVIQGSCAPMAGRVRCLAARRAVSEISEHSEHSEHSEWLADARSWLGVGAA